MKGLKGLATGIGSLPHKSAEEAVESVFRYCPAVPFWPQLPRRDKREGMIAQFAPGLPCMKVKNGETVFDPQDKEKELERFYERIIAGDVEYFALGKEIAEGLYRFRERLNTSDLRSVTAIKCHITGPFTFAASFKDEFQVILLHNPVYLQAIIKGLAMKALWQIQFFRKFAKPIILFIDEPYLGCFGSAYTPINREDVVAGLRDLTDTIKSENVLLGVHCCGNTDWSMFTDVAGIDVINFDAFGFLDKLVLYADSLKTFLQRNGIICWGIVPTQELDKDPAADALAAKIDEGIAILVKKGLPKALLEENLLLSPACGLGSLAEKKAETILKLLSEVSAVLRK